MKKILKRLMLIMGFITVLGIVGGGIFLYTTGKVTFEKQEKELSADKLAELVVKVPAITTNLSDGRFIQITFEMLAEDKKTKEELELRLFQVNDIINKELMELDSTQVGGKQNMSKLVEGIKNKVNLTLKEGGISEIYTTKLLIS